MNLKKNISRGTVLLSLARGTLKNPEVVRQLKGAILLRSLPKSGTNYLRLLLTNYFCNASSFLEDGVDAFIRVSYREMHSSIFPNQRHYNFSGRWKYKNPDLDRANLIFSIYSDFLYDHGSSLDALSLFRAKKTILLYRNPLDNIISKFFYCWKNRDSISFTPDHPREVIDTVLDEYILTYKLMYQYWLKSSLDRVILVSYEQLFEQPHSTLQNILFFLRLPVYPDLVTCCVEACTIKKTRDEEKKQGGPIHANGLKLSGSFARSGKVGQWQEFFNVQDIAYINAKFVQHGICPEVFWVRS